MFISNVSKINHNSHIKTTVHFKQESTGTLLGKGKK